MKISICGLGHIGLPLARLLAGVGHSIHGTTTSEDKKQSLSGTEINIHHLRSPELPNESILHCDVLVLNIPPFSGQEEWLSKWDLSKTGKIIFISSTSVLRGHPVLEVEESWLKSLGIPWLILRPGGLIGDQRHPGKYLSGKRNIKGRLNPVNIIHHDDVIGFIMTAIKINLSNESINLVSDEHRSKEEFYSDYCRQAGLPLPEFDLTDNSQGNIISNGHMKTFYQLKFPTMPDRSR